MKNKLWKRIKSKLSIVKTIIEHSEINKELMKNKQRFVINRCGRNDLCLCCSGKKYKNCVKE